MDIKEKFKDVLIAIQYLFVAAGATILVPLLTGIPVAVCLFTAGIGTLLFHFITGKNIPVLLSSSFAFIAPIIAVKEMYGIEYAFGGIMVAGLAYLLFALLLKLVGKDFIKRLFPPIITSTMVILIGLILAPVAIGNASSNWFIALLTFFIGMFIKITYDKSFFSSLSIIIAIIFGYLISIPFGLVDFSALSQASIVSLPGFVFPKFNISAIMIIAPIALVTFLEHFADISAVGKITEKDYFETPGIHRTLIGDGIATSIAGLLGGCPNTTYSENIGALEITGVKKAYVLRITAIFLVVFSFFPKLIFFINSIPAPVIGGISILLFGLISANGVKGFIQEQIDLKDFKNLSIVSSMLIIGVGGTVINVGIVQFSSLALAAIIGLLIHIIFDFKKIFLKGESK